MESVAASSHCRHPDSACQQNDVIATSEMVVTQGPNPGLQKTIVMNDKISNRSQGWGVTGAHAYRSGLMDRYEAFSRELGLSGTASD